MAKESKYKELDKETYYETPQGRGIVKISENKETKNKTIAFGSEAKTMMEGLSKINKNGNK